MPACVVKSCSLVHGSVSLSIWLVWYVSYSVLALTHKLTLAKRTHEQTEVSMTDADLEAEFILGWVSQTGPGLIQPPQQSPTDQEPVHVASTSKRRPSRLIGESDEKREQRLRLARECSARRRSLETAEQRERRLKEQRERMAQKRRTESTEEREIR